MKFIVSILLFVCLGNLGFAQEFFFVSFSEKEDVAFFLDNPANYLSNASIERRSKYGIPILEEDVPVSSRFIDTLVYHNIEVKYTSRWKNGAFVVSDSSSLNALDHDFILGYERLSSFESVSVNRKLNKVETAQSTSVFSDDADLLNVADMQQEGLNGDGIQIAVFDAGFIGVDQWKTEGWISSSAQVDPGYNFIEPNTSVYQYHDHGSQALSVMACNGTEFKGNSPNASFHLFVTEDIGFENRYEEFYWLLAAEKADSIGVDIISSSLGYSTFDDPIFNYTSNDLGQENSVIGFAARKVSEKGVLVVSSAGNEGQSSWYYTMFPADESLVLSVGAVNRMGLVTSFSSHGFSLESIKPNVCALGNNVRVLNGDRGLVFVDGTSFACPGVAGFAANLWSQHTHMSANEIKQLIEQASHKYFSPDLSFGYGIPNYNRVLINNGEFTTDKIIVSNPSQAFVQVLFPTDLNEQTLLFELFSVDGKQIVSQQLSVVDNRVVLEVAEVSTGVYVLAISGEFTNERKQIFIAK